MEEQHQSILFLFDQVGTQATHAGGKVALCIFSLLSVNLDRCRRIRALLIRRRKMKDASTNAVRYGHVDYPSLGTVSEASQGKHVHDAIDRRGISLLAIPCVETMFPNNTLYRLRGLQLHRARECFHSKSYRKRNDASYKCINEPYISSARVKASISKTVSRIQAANKPHALDSNFR